MSSRYEIEGAPEYEALGFNAAYDLISARDTLNSCAKWILKDRGLTYHAQRGAPDTLEGIKAAFEATGHLIVSSEHCTQTIYRLSSDNHRARAWHDFAHIVRDAPFTMAGETLTFWEQRAHLCEFWGREHGLRDKPFADCVQLLAIEIMGQAVHAELTGSFPVNQRAFAAGVWRYMLVRSVCGAPSVEGAVRGLLAERDWEGF